MNWNDHLYKNETIVWQGKPAPRCYTLRNWPHSLFGLVLLLACLVWFYVGINIGHDTQSTVYGWLPVPFLLASLYLLIGHLLIARLEWDSVYYAVTDQRVLAQQGLVKKTISSLLLEDIVWFRLKSFSENLGSVSIRGQRDSGSVTIACIEQPRQFTDLLEKAMVQSGVIPAECTEVELSGSD